MMFGVILVFSGDCIFLVSGWMWEVYGNCMFLCVYFNCWVILWLLFDDFLLVEVEV